MLRSTGASRTSSWTCEPRHRDPPTGAGPGCGALQRGVPLRCPHSRLTTSSARSVTVGGVTRTTMRSESQMISGASQSTGFTTVLGDRTAHRCGGGPPRTPAAWRRCTPNEHILRWMGWRSQTAVMTGRLDLALHGSLAQELLHPGTQAARRVGPGDGGCRGNALGRGRGRGLLAVPLPAPVRVPNRWRHRGGASQQPGRAGARPAPGADARQGPPVERDEAIMNARRRAQPHGAMTPTPIRPVGVPRSTRTRSPARCSPARSPWSPGSGRAWGATSRSDWHVREPMWLCMARSDRQCPRWPRRSRRWPSGAAAPGEHHLCRGL